MKKIVSYVKPYWVYVVSLMILLFCQAAVDLNLPNLMSDIVDVGIQRGGITETAPKAIRQESFEMVLRFSSEEDRKILEQNYILASEDSMTGKEWEEFLSLFPKAAKEKTLVFAPKNEDASQEAGLAFQRACYAITQMLQAAIGSGKEAMAKAPSEEEIRQYMLSSMLKAMPDEQIKAAIDEASKAPLMLLDQTSGVFIKRFYQELDAALEKIQNHYILLVGSKMLLMTLIIVCCTVGAGFCTSRLGTGVARDLRRDVFVRITSFTNNEYDKFGTASLITRTTNDVMQIRTLLSMGLRMVLYAPIIGFGGIMMALRKSAGMAWIIALAAGIIFIVVTMLFFIAVPKFRIMQKLVDKLNLVSRENLSGMMVIRAFATQKFEEERFAKANNKLARNNLFVFRAMATMAPTMTLVMNGISLLIVWVGGRKIAQSAMQVGDMMAFIQYTMQIIMSFLLISLIFVMVPRAVVSARRIQEILNSQPGIRDPEHPQKLPEQTKGVIEFKDVSFRYAGAKENVLEHISFTARPGQTTAIIGSTGSGKSTLVNLIPRFYDVTEGSVTLDGVDIRSIPLKELRDNISYVPQKAVLFSGDIASNLRYGDEKADEATLHKALDTAQASEFVNVLPKGILSPISQGGTNVSGGQRQRLCIARALVKKSPVCIFDDTFSALDFKTDAQLRAALRKQTSNVAVFIVAQRVSTIRRAEQIIVLDKGKAVGIGTHKQLLQTCQTYREIARSQLSEEELA